MARNNILLTAFLRLQPAVKDPAMLAGYEELHFKYSSFASLAEAPDQLKRQRTEVVFY